MQRSGPREIKKALGWEAGSHGDFWTHCHRCLEQLNLLPPETTQEQPQGAEDRMPEDVPACPTLQAEVTDKGLGCPGEERVAGIFPY